MFQIYLGKTMLLSHFRTAIPTPIQPCPAPSVVPPARRQEPLQTWSAGRKKTLIYIYMYIHTHMHTHIYIYIYTSGTQLYTLYIIIYSCVRRFYRIQSKVEFDVFSLQEISASTHDARRFPACLTIGP